MIPVMVSRGRFGGRMTARRRSGLFIVYEKPLDFPDEFVARSHNTEKKRTGAIIHAHRLAKLRQLLRDQGLYRIEHGAADDADVIESWL